MARNCSICLHSKRTEIETALLANETLRKTASLFGVSYPSLFRHRLHVTGKIAEVTAARVSEQVEAVAKHLEEQIENSPSLIDRLREVNEETRSILKQAKDAGNNELALKAIARLEKQIELKGRLIGELQGQASGNTTIEVTYVDKQVILRGQQNGGAEPIRAEIREPILIEGTSLDEY